MKRILSLILCAALLLSCCPIIPLQASAATSGICGDNLTWTLDDEGTLTISGTGAMVDFASSSSAPWYDSRESVKNVIIESGITSIGDYAFYECTNLADVTIPDTVTSIAWHVFRYCSSLTGITIPGSVTSIGGYAFEYCTGLTTLTIPDSVTSIGNAAFGSCSQLKTVTIGAGVTSIGNSSFRLCPKLKDMYYEGTQAQWEQISFGENGYLDSLTLHTINGVAVKTQPVKTVYRVNESLDATGLVLTVSYTNGGEKEITEGYTLSGFDSATAGTKTVQATYREQSASFDVTVLVDYGTCGENLAWTLDGEGTLAISGTGPMKNYDLLLDEFLVVTGTSAPWYSYRGRIYNVIIESGVTAIGDYAFDSCTSLTSVTIPDSVTAIGIGAFADCDSLSSVTIPDSVTVIGIGAFSGCDSLTDVYYNGTQAQWEQIAVGSTNEKLTGATLHTNEIISFTVKTQPTKSVYLIGESLDTTGLVLTAVYSDGSTEEITEGYTVSGFDSVTTGTKTVTVTYKGNRTSFEVAVIVISVVDSGTCGSWGDNLTWSLDNLGTLTISGTGDMELYWFWDRDWGSPAPWFDEGTGNNTTVKAVVIEPGVTSIGGYAFYRCYNLESITIPSSVLFVGEKAFYGCDKLTAWYYGGNEEQWKDIDGMFTPNAESMHYNQNLNIVEEGVCGDNLTWTLDSYGALTIYGTGPMYDWSATGENTSPWNGNAAIKVVVMEDSVTTIGTCAFVGCSNLWRVSIPDDITAIGKDAFKDGRSKNVRINDLATWCNVDIAEGGNPLRDSSDLYLSGNLVEELVIPASVTVIKDYTFEGFDGLESVTIHDSVTSIGNYAFNACDYLQNVTVGSSVTSIGNSAFAKCSNMDDIILPASVTTIGDSAFAECDDLDIVYYVGNERQWQEISVASGNDDLCNAMVRYNFGDVVSRGTCGDTSNLIWLLDKDGVLTIFGNGDMYSYWFWDGDWGDAAPWSDNGYTGGNSSITEVIIEPGVTSIGGYAFYRSKNLQSITIPTSVTTIGDRAFHDCDSLTDVYYIGTQEQWDQISNTDELAGATVNVNARGAITNIFVKVLPDKTVYKVNESLKTAGLVLSVTYADGSGFDITNGYTVSGFDSSTTGTKTVTVTYEGKTTTFDVGVFVASGTCGDNLTWTLDGEGTLTIFGTGAMTNYTYETRYRIPWYYDRDSIKNVVIQSGVTTVGAWVFRDCTNLTTAKLPDGLITISSSAFSNCTQLSSVNIPDSVTTIGYGSFYNCDITSVIIPDGVKTVGESAFSSCDKLTVAVIGDSVTGIGPTAFYKCSRLTAITVPSTVTTVGNSAFEGCTALTDVYYAGTQAQWDLITVGDTNEALTGATIHFNEPAGIIGVAVKTLPVKTKYQPGESLDTTGLILTAYYSDGSTRDITEGYTTSDLDTTTGGTKAVVVTYEGKSTTFAVTVPEHGTCGENLTWFLDDAGTLTISGTGAMANYSYSDTPWYDCRDRIKNVIIGDSVTTIGNSAFGWCYNLTSVTIGSSVATIGDSAFYSCHSLTSVTIPNSVTTIGSEAFCSCDNLSSVTIGDSVTTIGGWAFYFCYRLTSITIPDSVTTIREGAFADCSSLTSVTLGSGVTYIGDAVFDYCTNLTGIWVDANNTAFSSDDSGVLFNKDKTTLLRAPRAISGAYTIPESVTTIGYNAFYYCDGLTSVTIGNNVTNIHEGAFYRCDSLTDVYYIGSVTQWAQISISDYDNECLTEAAIHYSEIAAIASLVIKSLPNKVIYNFNESLDTTGLVLTVTYPDGSTEDVTKWFTVSGFDSTTDGIKTVTVTYGDKSTTFDVEAFYAGACGGRLTWSLDDEGTLTISGTGAIPGYSSASNMPWYSIREKIKTVIIGDNVTTIGWHAFKDCTNLTSVTIGESVTTIGGYAFEYCTSLDLVNIREGVTSVGNAAFGNCTSLTTVIIDDSVTTIGDYAFRVCPGLTDVYYTGSQEQWDQMSIGTGNELLTNATIHLNAPAIILGISIKTLPTKTDYAAGESLDPAGLVLTAKYSDGSTQDITEGYTLAGFDSTTGGTKTVTVTYEGRSTSFDVVVIVEVISGTCGENLIWSLDSVGTLTISGAGAMEDYAAEGAPWFDNWEDIKRIVLGDDVTSIGNAAFGGCTNLATIAVSESFAAVGVDSFSGCTQLTDVYFAGTKTQWGQVVIGAGNETLMNARIHAVDGTIVASGTCDDNLTWTLDDAGTLTISGTGAMIDFASSTAAPWYDSRESIQNVIIESGVTSIGDYAFYECTNLTSITIPDTVTSIAWHVFRYCRSLTSITIPNSVTSIAGYAFEYCTGLTTLTIPDSVTSIGNAAFGSCSQLTTVTIGAGVTTIGNSAFRLCPKLTDVYYNGNQAQWDQISIAEGNEILTNATLHVLLSGACGENLTWVLDDEGTLTISGTGSMTDFESSTSTPWYTYWTRIKKVILEPGVTTIGDWAFAGCENMTAANVPDSVTAIGMGAFCECFNLASVTLGDNVVSIGWMAFYYTGLTTIEIPESVTDIGGSAFDGCRNLTSATIPGNVKSIGIYAFRGCNLTNVTIPASVIAIEEGAFSSCYNLTGIWVDAGNQVYSSDDKGFLFNKDQSILIQAPLTISGEYTIPDSVTTIGDWAFCDCTSLTSVTIPNSVTTIGSGAFDYCTSLTSVTIPDSVTSIGGQAFNSCSSLTSVTIPNSVTTIGSGAFDDCTSLTSVTIGNSVTTIGDWAFCDCTSLTSVTIPDSVTSIGGQAFNSCSSLTSVTIGNSVTTIGDYAFSGCTSLNDVYYTGTKAQWDQISIGTNNGCLTNAAIRTADGITIIANGTCGENITWTLDDKGTLTISGTGAMTNYTYGTLSNVPWYSRCESIKKVVINSGVTTVGSWLFRDCTSLTTVTLPDGLTAINACAFSNCTSLRNVTILDGVTTIGDYAFVNCFILTSVTIGNSVTTIGDYAFYNCGSLTDVYYTGTKTQWDQITIGTDNESLTNATLHTVASVMRLAVKTEPAKKIYLTGESLETTGLVLMAIYSDSTTKEITEGYTVSGFDSSTTGKKTVTVTYEGCTADFDVFVVGELDKIFDSNGNCFETLTDAIKDVVEGDKLTFVKDIIENVTVNKTVSLDLNGFSVTGTLTIENGNILYGMDVQTDDYTIRDGKGYGKISKVVLEGNGKLMGLPAESDLAEHGYMMITEDDGVSFHCVNLQLKSMSLRAADSGIYFKSDFAGDELVAENVMQFGVALSVQGIPNAGNMATDCKYSQFTVFEAGKNADATSTLLKGVMKSGNAALTNQRNANMAVYGRGYILTNDGEYIFGTAASRTFKQQVEAIDTMWSSLSASQKNSVKQMYQQFATVMKSWNLPNLKESLK